MKMGSISVVVIAALVIGFGGYAFKKYQDKQNSIAETEQVLADLKNLERKYIDFFEQSKLASATPRSQLSPVVARMQDTLKVVTEMHSSGCAVTSHTALRQSVENMKDGFLSFMSYNEIKSDAQITVAKSLMTEFESADKNCREETKKKLDDLRK